MYNILLIENNSIVLVVIVVNGYRLPNSVVILDILTIRRIIHSHMLELRLTLSIGGTPDFKSKINIQMEIAELDERKLNCCCQKLSDIEIDADNNFDTPSQQLKRKDARDSSFLFAFKLLRQL
ncbi:16639_t:CDS:2 [Cetraspora pellucida]|uniref:16639_t:CDS:1 n=1 Tax=Cetraspora pellucida TaxID=1433469 RepID=A0ACA9JYS0_9GLOM|nr:16639_t:CDS:2 [Cetraspora pellucida]